MRVKAEKKNGKEPKKSKGLSVKFNPRLNVVSIKGLEEEAELPQSLIDVLSSYGFEPTEDTGVWFDSMVDNLDPEHLSQWAPVSMTVSRQGRKKTMTWEVSIGDCATQKSTDKNDAMEKARRRWNMNGRPIDNTPLIDAIEKAIEQKAPKRSRAARNL